MSTVVTIDIGNAGRPDTEGNWVSGAVASLGISSNVTVVFDLGPLWRMIRSVVVAGVGLADSTAGTVSATYSADSAGSVRSTPATAVNSTSGKVSYSAALSGFVMQLMVNDRYLRVAVNNGSSAAQPASASMRVIGYEF